MTITKAHRMRSLAVLALGLLYAWRKGVLRWT